MNTLKFILFIFFVSIVEIVSSQPLAITKIIEMSFGNSAVISAGTIVLTPASTRTATGGVTLPAVTGTITAASFNVTGTPNVTYTITLPLSITISSGANMMTLDTFTSTPSGTGTLSALGTQTLTVGATLHIAGAQVPGTYLSGVAFTVTVN